MAIAMCDKYTQLSMADRDKVLKSIRSMEAKCNYGHVSLLRTCIRVVSGQPDQSRTGLLLLSLSRFRHVTDVVSVTTPLSVLFAPLFLEFTAVCFICTPFS